MRKFAIVAALVAACAAGSGATSAGAAPLALGACGGGWECGKLAVPAERGGSTQLELNVWRLKFAGEPSGQHSTSAVFGLAGGPGQAAVPLREELRRGIEPALRGRDLIVIDQRGTGESAPLHCAAFATAAHSEAELVSAIGRCSDEVAEKGIFTTAESVSDMEAVRAALDYEKLVLYGTSYGTKVALNYAERFPAHVESMVLDSVVLPGGNEPFRVQSFEAVAPMLKELCSQGPCHRFAPNPVGELATLARRLARNAILGSIVLGNGQHRLAGISEAGLWEVLVDGDLNPALRALVPAAVHAALHGENGQLLRLQALADGAAPTLPRSAGGGEPEVNEVLYYATSCEETPFPWSRSAGFDARLQSAAAALAGIPGSSFYPFSGKVAFDSGLFGYCAAWTDHTPAPEPAGELPDVPTLILSGGQDLRTPTADARTVAAEIPDAKLVVVPFTGHSVIGSDFSDCASDAVRAFFAGATVQACGPTRETFHPTPPVPRTARGLAATAHIRGLPGRTVTAALETLAELRRELITAVFNYGGGLPRGTAFGGLDSGYSRVGSNDVVVHDYSAIPGVTLNGRLSFSGFTLTRATLKISGRHAAHGTLDVNGRSGRVRGRLGGRRFDRSTAAAHLSAVAGGEWPDRELRYRPLP